MKKWLFIFFYVLLIPLSLAAPKPAEQVFPIRANYKDPNTFTVYWDIAAGYFLYKDRIQVLNSTKDSLFIAPIVYPEATKKVDSLGKTHAVYRNTLSLPISVLAKDAGDTIVTVQYQGCSDDGFCYPPQKSQIILTIDKKLSLSNANLSTLPVASNEKPTNQESDFFSNHHWSITILLFFGLGVLLSFTPCVLPMVPILSGILIGHSSPISARKAFMLSLSYVLSMSFTYALIGAGVALLGNNLQIFMQNPWSISAISAVFVLLSLSMFGLYELKLPNAFQEKLSKATKARAGGHYLGAALMGCFSTLIVSPCVTAPLVGALGYIADTGNVTFGLLALFFLGLGMGAPLLLIGMSLGRWLPSTGSWMIAIKAFFGFLLLALAISTMSRILPTQLTMVLWGTLLVFSGVSAGALTYSVSIKEKLHQAIGILLLIYGILILIGASMGQTNPLQPLTGFKSKVAAMPNPFASIPIDSIEAFNEALTRAKGKPVIVKFYADWCVSCQVMETTIFQNAKVQKALQSFALLKIDLTANTATDFALMKHLNVIAPPTFLVFNKEGEAMVNQTLVGEVTAKEFLAWLKRL